MGDTILIDGDMANFIPAFGSAIVVVQPGTLTGSGKANALGKVVCVDGDEASVEVKGCMYTAPPFVIPGTGTITIAALAPDQIAKKTNSGGKAVLLKGSVFTAQFDVDSQAKMPTPSGPQPDPVPTYMGNGTFISTNMTVKGS